MNYMEQVAQMLGVELGEEFEVADTIRFKNFKFDNERLLAFDEKYKCWCSPHDVVLRKLITGEYKIVKPILDDIEKVYLSNIIKPFRDMVTSVIKYDSGKYEYIAIKCRSLEEYIWTVHFPPFKKGTMYKGMKTGKKYTLEELGL